MTNLGKVIFTDIQLLIAGTCLQVASSDSYMDFEHHLSLSSDFTSSLSGN